MALNIMRSFSESFLELEAQQGDLFTQNHILEPEFHQEKYVNACAVTRQLPGAFQVGDLRHLVAAPYRGKQPAYADSEEDPSSLCFEGMIRPDGSRAPGGDGVDVCALKSNCVRRGFIDLGLARSVTKEWYQANRAKCGVVKNDVLVNSTGDGTIGRVAVYPFDFPSVVDGHITILRFRDPALAWYVAAYLLSEDGQRQLYRYINGSSGQVELYPQDIGRVWVRPAAQELVRNIAAQFQAHCAKFDEFAVGISATLAMVRA